jgi:CubicO group peptidase (beta-lactamase class C family)
VERRLIIARRTSLALVAALLLSFGVKAEDCGTPVASEDRWPIATPTEVGLNTETLCRIGVRFDAWREANIHSVLVARHGKLVFERYFSGIDENWGTPTDNLQFTIDVKHDIRSITKSVTSLLLGIAIGRGLVPDVDTSVLSLFPEYADLRSTEKERITLKHLLTMSAGFTWDENTPYTSATNSETRMDFASDPYRYVLEQPVDSRPGALYNYSGGSAALISAVLHKATGKTEDVLAQELLFTPLGISDVGWGRYPANDEPMAASGLRMRPRDLAKLGQLILNRGQWDGHQIVPTAWIDASMTPQIQGAQLYFYGYQWWLGRSLVAGHNVDWTAGVGLGGQRLFIVPSLDLVVVVTAGLYSSELQGWVPLQILNRHVLAAVRTQ